MQLKGSCHCGGVNFTLDSVHPCPFNLCYCSICRKTAGGGGYAINLGGDFDTLKVEGESFINVYQAKINDPDLGGIKQSPAQRSFCKKCGTALWVWDPRWPELVHPFASAIDSELPKPPVHTHMMLKYKASWVEVNADVQDQKFDAYPKESLAQWHERLGLQD